MDKQNKYWQAVQSRDSRYDGVFYYGVLTTGIYCNPSCKTRLALQKNICFFDSINAAEKFGLRACKKCTPEKCTPSKSTQAIEEVVHSLCRTIEAKRDEKITLAEIAKKSGYSASHIQKAFTTIVGSSPKAFQTALRSQQLKTELKSSATLSDAIYGAGYGSPSRVYEKKSRSIGMTPKQYRSGGKQVQIHYASCKTSLGTMMIGATERGICFLHFGDKGDDLYRSLAREFPNADLSPMPEQGNGNFAVWVNALNAYLDQKKKLRDLPLDIQGTAFQILVWRYLQSIPAGEVRSYGEVAAGIGKPKAIRAVATACARNNIALAIPCHRVLRGDGALAGYRWGLERKRALIALEHQKV